MEALEDVMSKGYVAQAEITIEAPPARVWDALTKPELIKQYLFGTDASSDWKVGSPITYRGVWEGKPYEDKGVIEEIVHGERLVSTYWSPLSGTTDSPENYSTITWEIRSEGRGTRLTLSQDNNESEESASHSQGNWEMVLAKMKEILEAPGE